MERKGREKVVAWRRVERTGIVVVVVMVMMVRKSKVD